MLATDSIQRLASGSPLHYFSDADVQRYLELQQAVRSVWSGTERQTKYDRRGKRDEEGKGNDEQEGR